MADYGGKMKRPQDPRKHGLKEPLKIIDENHSILIPHSAPSSGYYSNQARCSLDTAMERWRKAKLEIEGRDLVEGPFIDSKGSQMSLVFTTRYNNPNYTFEKEIYDAEVKAYEEKVLAYEAFLKRKEQKIKDNLNDKIANLERRLVNMKAYRDGLPIPYPEE